jgi:hypothetical protein
MIIKKQLLKYIIIQCFRSTLINTLINLMYYLTDYQCQIIYVLEHQLMNTLHYITIYIDLKSVMYFVSINQLVAMLFQNPLNVFYFFTIIT